MADQRPKPPIVVTHEGGVRFAAQVRSHRVLVDQPVHAGGEDSAPAPIELLAVSLGTCVAFYVLQFCRARGVADEGMRIEVETASATNPNRIAHFALRVVPPADLPAHYVPMLERIVRSCPAHNTLDHGADISITIETAAPVEAFEVTGASTG
jgi:uncharacterized OsmC-like protein